MDSDSQLSPNDEFLKELGYLVVQANYLEEALVDLYWIVSGKNELEVMTSLRGKTLGALKKTVLEDFRARVDNQEFLERMDMIEPLLDEALALRNSFVHAVWVFAGDEMQRRRLPRSGELVELLDRMTAKDVAVAYEKISDAQDAVQDLYDDFEPTVRGQRESRGGFVVDGVYRPQVSRKPTGET